MPGLAAFLPLITAALEAAQGQGAPTAPDPMGGQAPGINMTPTAQAPSAMNAEILKADGQAPPPPPIDIPTEDLDVVQIPEGPGGGDGMFAGMTKTEKMAAIASLGSLLRGPGPPPPPGAPGGGGPGIDMQPVFLRDLRG